MVSGSWVGGWGAIGYGGSSRSSGKIICLGPLGHKVVSFVKPLVNGVRRGIHGVDLFHEMDRDSCGKVTNEGSIGSGARDQGMVLELSNIGIDFFSSGSLSETVDGQLVNRN